MDASDTPFIIVLAILLVCSALASASETALFGITHGQRATLKRSNPRLSRIVESLLLRPRELLMQVLLLNMVVNVSYFIVTSILTIHATSTGTRIIISVVSVATIILIGEVFAKLFAASATMLFLRLAAPMHIVIRGAIAPLLRFLDLFVIAPLSRLLAPPKSSSNGQAQTVTPEQMGTLIHLSAHDGVIDPGEQELLNSIVTMGHMRVEQVMTPRVDMSWITLDTTRDEIIDICRSTRRTQLLVCAKGIDEGVSGFVDARRVLDGEPIESALEKVLYIPEQGRLDSMIEQFRKTGKSVAICVDEHGGVAGIMTITDIAKELIKGVRDPDQHLASEIELISLGKWIVPGRLSIRDWSMMFSDKSIIEHTKRVNTIGGLIMVILDRVPKVGDVARIGDIEMRVVEMDQRSIERVIVEIQHPKEPATKQESNKQTDQKRGAS